jgi:ribokinase
VIVVVGSVNLDLVARVRRLPDSGETVAATGFTRVPGGKGANQALAARRLGAPVRLVAATGADPLAGEAVSLLREGGVDLGRVRTAPDQPTGLALIEVDDAGDTTIVVVPGANATLRVHAQDVADADAVLAVLEVPVDAVALAATLTPPTTFFALNAAPAMPVPHEVLARTNLLVVNRSEHAVLGAAASVARCVAVTHGADGAVLLRDGVEVARAAGPPVHAVDGTAAGDAFTAALVVAMLAGTPDADALRRACAAGALAATRHGAQPSLPTAAEVDAVLG